jgi:hypothetical protein
VARRWTYLRSIGVLRELGGWLAGLVAIEWWIGFCFDFDVGGLDRVGVSLQLAGRIGRAGWIGGWCGEARRDRSVRSRIRLHLHTVRRSLLRHSRRSAQSTALGAHTSLILRIGYTTLVPDPAFPHGIRRSLVLRLRGGIFGF